jgi:chorismate mutase / prephenate dehydratase
MPPADNTLDALRREIDAVDDAMHDLLIKRATLSEAVGALKGENNAVFRPGREAMIARRLVERHRGALPPEVVVQVWREIIAASIRLQAPFRVAVHASNGKGHALDLAREHFGVLTPLLPTGSTATVLNAIAEGEAQLGLLPLPEDVPNEPWWRGLGKNGPGALFILARLPFVTAQSGAVALIVGRQPFEPTGADRGYIVVETNREISRARLSRALTDVGLKPLGFPAEVIETGRREDGTVFLVETETLAERNDPRFVSLIEAVSEVFGVRSVGGYAIPIALPPRRK